MHIDACESDDGLAKQSVRWRLSATCAPHGAVIPAGGANMPAV